MQPEAWIATAGGGALVALASADVFLTIVHPDIEGPLAKGVQRAVWSVFRPLARASGRRRRKVLALAGPVMIGATLLAWAACLIVGYALLAWPHLSTAFARSPGLGAPDFAEALYWAGTTATTLGYGDVTPHAWPLQALALSTAASGFALFTAALAFTLSVLRAISERDVFTLRVHGMTGGTGDGTALVARSARDEGPEGVRRKLEDLGDGLRSLQERFHRHPMLAFCYRSEDPAYDPEPMVKAASEAALAGGLLGTDPGWRAIRVAAEDLDHDLARFHDVVARRHVRAALAAVRAPQATAKDRAEVARVRARLEGELGRPLLVGREEQEMRTRQVARSRAFLEGLDKLTEWRPRATPGQGLGWSAHEPDRRDARP